MSYFPDAVMSLLMVEKQRSFPFVTSLLRCMVLEESYLPH